MKKNLVDILRQDCRIGELQTMKTEVENSMKAVYLNCLSNYLYIGQIIGRISKHIYKQSRL